MMMTSVYKKIKNKNSTMEHVVFSGYLVYRRAIGPGLIFVSHLKLH